MYEAGDVQRIIKSAAQQAMQWQGSEMAQC